MKNGISSAFIKNLAIVLMLINHWCDILIIKGVLTNNFLCAFQYCATRGAFVIFAFQLAESIDKTSNKKKFLLRLFIVALISEFPFDIALNNSQSYLNMQNVFWTLFFAALSIILIKSLDSKILKTIVILLTFIVSVLFRADYGLFGILVVYIFYFMKHKKEKFLFIAILLFLGVGINDFMNFIFFGEKKEIIKTILNMLMEFSGVAIIPVLALYNGKKGKQLPKAVYYLFYPLHLIIGKALL